SPIARFPPVFAVRLLRFVGSLRMPMSVWIAAASALALASSLSLWPYASAAAEMVRHGALIAAIGIPVLRVTCDFLRRVRSGWRRWSSRPYLGGASERRRPNEPIHGACALNAAGHV